MNTPTTTPTQLDYAKASRLLQHPGQIANLIRQLGQEVLGRGTLDDIAYLIASGAIKIVEA